MQADSIKKTVGVALGVCLVCSVLVSTSAVYLQGIQEQNKRLDKVKNILIAGGLYEENAEIQQIFENKIESSLIELASGKELGQQQYNEKLNPKEFEIKNMADDPEYSIRIADDNDIARIKRRPKHMVVYSVMEGESVDKFIFPVHGKGLWSTMYGFVALDKDLKTIRGITFYDHGETPGLGGEIENPRWRASWEGKVAFNEANEVILQVLKGQVDKSRPDAEHQIDGLSGATLTTRGVGNMIHYWFGENGYGPFLDKLREAGTNG